MDGGASAAMSGGSASLQFTHLSSEGSHVLPKISCQWKFIVTLVAFLGLLSRVCLHVQVPLSL